MPEMVSGALAEFDRTIDWDTLVVLRGCAPKLMTPGGEIAICVPMPVKLIVCVEVTPLSLSVMVMVPVRGPVAVGVKTILMLHK